MVGGVPGADSPLREVNVLFLVLREGSLPLLPEDDDLLMISGKVNPVVTEGTAAELDKPVKLLSPVSASSACSIVVEVPAIVEPLLLSPLSKSLRTS